jgi:hypothetical protein
MWPKIICDELRIKLVNLGPQQITDINFPNNDSNNNRNFSASHYKHILKNRETILQTWLIYSELRQCLLLLLHVV